MKTDKKSATAYMVELVRDGLENPFTTLESLSEQLGSLHYALVEAGHDMVRPPQGATQEQIAAYMKGIAEKDRDILYHFLAVESYEAKLFQYLVALWPRMYAASEGNAEALASMKDELTRLAAAHQQEWDLIMSSMQSDD